MLRSLEKLLAEHQAAKATSVNVIVGEFAGVEPDLLESAFKQEAEGGAAEGARLCIMRTSLAGKCDCCRHEFPIKRFRFVCPLCGANNVTVKGGEELLLESVTMEVVT
ncbi:MAG: hydrogenase maturation nickel metallochaperone HypA [Hyphomicrobiales bacterium]|nr:hydrogenase maturation nickel metallochaperone HypA [Hyphomicrobiales bacterium]